MAEAYRVGVRAFIQRRGKLLLIPRQNEYGQKCLGFPGGRICNSESIQQALTRLIKVQIPHTHNSKIGTELVQLYVPESYLTDGFGRKILMHDVKIHLTGNSNSPYLHWLKINNLKTSALFLEDITSQLLKNMLTSTK